MKMHKNILISAAKYTITLLITTIVCTILVVLTYALPTERMFLHAKESKESFNEAYIESWAPGIESATIPTQSDAIMINNAIFADSKHGATHNAMMNPRYENGRGNPRESLCSALDYKTSRDIKISRYAMTQVDSFKDEANEGEALEAMYYPRYWHGYLVLLKPLLLFCNVSEIKMISTGFLLLLLFLAIILIREKISANAAVAFATMIVIINPVTIALSLHESIILLLTLMACSAVLLLSDEKNSEKRNYAFAVLGGATSFFDFLTYPLMTLGVPLAILLLLKRDEDRLEEQSMQASLAWGIGYAGLWIGKFLACSSLTDYNALYYGFQSVLFRVGSGEKSSQYETSVFAAIHKNVGVLINWQTFAIIMIIATTIILAYRRGYRYKPNMKLVKGLLIIATFPFIWYAVMSNHSTIHYYFTFRNLSVTWFCIAAVILMGWEKSSERR